MAEDLNCKQSAANRADHRVNGIPCGIDPWNLVGEKFQEVENAGDRNNRRVAQHFEGLIGRRERNPMEMDGQSGDENGEIEIDASQCGKTESDREEVQFFHGESIGTG